MRPKLPATHWPLAVMLLVAVLAACGSGAGPPGNVTDGEWQAMRKFADDTESQGSLRPLVPTYLPEGFDRTPHLFIGGTREGRTIVLFGPLYSSVGANPRPGELEIIRWGSDPDVTSPTPYAPCDELDDGEECVDIQGRDARLENPSRLDAESVSYHVEFQQGNSVVWVSVLWEVSEGTKNQFEEALRSELLKVAESVVEP